MKEDIRIMKRSGELNKVEDKKIKTTEIWVKIKKMNRIKKITFFWTNIKWLSLLKKHGEKMV